MAVIQLARLDAQRHPVLGRRKRAGRVGGERARRVVGLVEVEDDPPVLRQVGVKEAPGRVGLLAAGLVADDEEELPGVLLLEYALQPDLLALALEDRVA